MTTYALPISDRLALQLAVLPADKIDAVHAEIVEILTEFLEEEATSPDAYSLSDEDKASLSRAFADVEAGRVYEGDNVMAELFTRVGMIYPQPEVADAQR